jgi:hypothetical protein
MDNLKKEKLHKFANDQVMLDAVREIMEGAILSKKGSRDVYVLAAERIAIDVLTEAWKEIARFKLVEEEGEKITKQVGL